MSLIFEICPSLNEANINNSCLDDKEDANNNENGVIDLDDGFENDENFEVDFIDLDDSDENDHDEYSMSTSIPSFELTVSKRKFVAVEETILLSQS